MITASVDHMITESLTTSSSAESSPRQRKPPDNRVWVLRRHVRVTLRQSHAIVEVDWDAGIARTSCGLELQPGEITDIPAGGCMPCEACVGQTPRQPDSYPPQPKALEA